MAGVFDAIIGTSFDGTCAAMLGDLTVTTDFKDEHGHLHCASGVMGDTPDGDADDPTVILCPDGLKHGAIKVRTGSRPSPVTCDSINADGDRVTWRMETLGSILLHEYTHFARLVSPPLGQGAFDVQWDGEEIYGPVQVQKVAGSTDAELFADVYTWFANEVFWSGECGKTFGKADPAKNDDRDPACGGMYCDESDPSKQPKDG